MNKKKQKWDQTVEVMSGCGTNGPSAITCFDRGEIKSRQMDDVTIARALHVLSVILWIGGAGFVTTVLLERSLPQGAR